MNSLQRVISAIEFRPVDRIPIALHNFQMCAQQSGMDFERFYQNGQSMADNQMNLWNEFHQDVIMLENGTAALAGALGCGTIYRRNQPPVVVAPRFKSIDDVDQLEKLPALSDCSILCENLKATGIVAKQLGSNVFVMGRGDQGPFSLAALLLGMEELLIEIVTGENDDKVHRLLDYCTDFIISYCTNQIKQGALCTSIGDSTAGPDVVSPGIYEKFALPYEKRIVDAIHDAGGMVALHICGNATRIIEKMIRTGADILEIDEKTDLLVAKAAANGHSALLGQVSPRILRTGTREEIKMQAMKNIRSMGCETGFILGAGCALASDTPFENVCVLFEARDEYLGV